MSKPKDKFRKRSPSPEAEPPMSEEERQAQLVSADISNTRALYVHVT